MTTTNTAITLADCQKLDQADPLRSLRDLFDIPEGVTYFCGNSLGAMPKSANARFEKTIKQEWGVELIRAWNTAGWFELPRALGNRLAEFIGAKQEEVVVTDSTSINLYKVLYSAIQSAKSSRTKLNEPKRNIILSERSNFPTDLYIAEALCAQHGFELKLIEPEELSATLTKEVAVLMLTHVNYRTGAMLNMAEVTAAAHKVGALAIWDLAHSAGAVPVDLNGANADFAVGCTYKFLNGGPGSPAFLWVHEKHMDSFDQPLSGWWGHAAPFEMSPEYHAAKGISRYLCGTQGIVSMVGVDAGLGVFEAAQKLGGMDALRKKSLALTDLFIALVTTRCAGFGLEVATPIDHANRGSQVSLTKREGAYEIMKALIKRGVIGDFRKGDGKQHIDILRFGFTPLYLGYADVWHAVETLHHVLSTEEWKNAEFAVKAAVT